MEMLDQAHEEYLESRGLDIEMAAKYNIKTKGDRIAIPYMRNGEFRYAKHLDPKKEQYPFCAPKGVEQTEFWNADCLQGNVLPTSMLIVNEGEFDSLSCLQVGEEFVVSLPSGGADTPQGAASKARKAFCATGDGSDPRLKRSLEQFRRILLMFDHDSTGLAMREAAIDLIGQDYCYIPEYPEGCKDANDVLRIYGPEALAEVIADAKPARSMCYMPLTDGLNEGIPKQFKVGIPLLDKHLVISQPEFMIVGGPAGSGKSTIAQIILINLLRNNPTLRASIFHGEGHKSIVTKRFLAWYRHNMDSYEGGETGRYERDQWLNDRLSFLHVTQGEEPTFDWLLWAMEQHALTYHRNVLVVDPWNEILHTRPSHKTMTDHVGECIIRMKRLATRLNLILIVVHHVTKPGINRDKPPTMYDLADSAHWANKSDHVLMVSRPSSSENRTLLEVVKSKDHELLGRPGQAWVTLNSEKFQLFTALPPSGPGGSSAEDQCDHPGWNR
jgi:twinkle protein